MYTTGTVPLINSLIARISGSTEGSISFRDYMEACLYHESWGYYMSDSPKLGREGDYYTSSFVGSLMGEMTACALSPYLVSLPDEQIMIVEWGGGSGRLAKQMLDTWEEKFPEIYERIRYVSIEKSPAHRRLQYEALARHASKIEHLTSGQWIQGGPYRSVAVISNEVPDAFPVYRYIYEGTGWREIRVGWSEDSGKFIEIYEGKPVPEHECYLSAYLPSPAVGQKAEVNMDAITWMKEIGQAVESGYVLTLDYGHEAEELYAAHRREGTLLCYYQHQASSDPFIRVGEQDMTAHVNFSACIDAGEQAGLELVSLKTQKEFLVEAGILGELQEHAVQDPFSPAARRNRGIRQLLLSDQMSELFKVMLQSKGVKR
ncbi:class I SAM-dependent methyltransferase [Paenibacillus gansuensis]|uniref:Class I SAM-dependent methyltransferase n=1 Tax=Paenibacillus gansuensis TaxID=306542 RepID=A0ABW5PE98_9BACL